ncbi:polygalacturonase ADPG2-like [Momordica charantia]|uniref:Polygalacturonase ADPG2-like n=1 Tax=Momordica charantia TaxID=3673 RepID=A0A6J1DIR2_MOMCH|nr:polygalacturonase ADPG2-like [Momordica charantia]
MAIPERSHAAAAARRLIILGMAWLSCMAWCSSAVAPNFFGDFSDGRGRSLAAAAPATPAKAGAAQAGIAPEAAKVGAAPEAAPAGAAPEAAKDGAAKAGAAPAAAPAGAAPAGAASGGKVIDVKAHGAVPDGKKVSTQAFMNAWVEACRSTGPTKLLFSAGTFLIGPVVFAGPCTASPMTVEIQGTVKATTDLSEYSGPDWILFESVNDLTITGSGTFDGQGQEVWKFNDCSQNPRCVLLAHTIKLNKVKKGLVEHVSSVNAKAFHFFLCRRLDHKCICASIDTNKANVRKRTSKLCCDELTQTTNRASTEQDNEDHNSHQLSVDDIFSTPVNIHKAGIEEGSSIPINAAKTKNGHAPTIEEGQSNPSGNTTHDDIDHIEIDGEKHSQMEISSTSSDHTERYEGDENHPTSMLVPSSCEAEVVIAAEYFISNP